MKTILIVIVLLLAGCASYDGRGLIPGQATAEQVEALMGPSTDKRTVGNETWVYYSRQPYGLTNYVARIGQDDRLIAVEQRLTEENVAKIVRGQTRRDEVFQLLGPPYRVWNFPRMPREVPEWRMLIAGAASVPQGLYVQMTPDDGVVREVFIENDPDRRLSDCCSTR
jgi:hypothetical protein